MVSIFTLNELEKLRREQQKIAEARRKQEEEMAKIAREERRK
jgi:hypothetical protein